MVCKKCDGLGHITYGDTSTYMHGWGGQMLTEDICEKCWGSGDEKRPFKNLRELTRKASMREVTDE